MPILQMFTLTEEHLKLLSQMYVGWQFCEFGAPEIDPKRPYGNSDVVGDIAEILGIPFEDAEDEEIVAQLTALHRETEQALQLVLALVSSGELPTPGAYEAPLYTRDWTRKEDS